MGRKKKIYAVYQFDQWLSWSSSVVIGLFESKECAIEAIKKHHKIPRNEWDGMTKGEFGLEIERELKANGQTQGYSFNYMVSEKRFNAWEE